MTKPDDMSVAELRAELKARAEKQAVGGGTAERLRDPDLEEVEDAELVQTLIAKQKVIYGVDDRADIFELSDAADRRDADSVAALFRAAEVIDNGNGTSRLATQNFGVSYGLCAGEPFRDQPVGAFCSGFLVGPDLAAHRSDGAQQRSVARGAFAWVRDGSGGDSESARGLSGG